MKFSGSTHSKFMRYRWTRATWLHLNHCHGCPNQTGLCFWKWMLWLQVYWNGFDSSFHKSPKMCFSRSNVGKVTTMHNNFNFTTQGWKQYVCLKLFFLKYGIKSLLYVVQEVKLTLILSTFVVNIFEIIIPLELVMKNEWINMWTYPFFKMDSTY